jgi:hypothetical protein
MLNIHSNAKNTDKTVKKSSKKKIKSILDRLHKHLLPFFAKKREKKVMFHYVTRKSYPFKICNQKELTQKGH